MLAWRPGEMTRRYIAGERARFVSPVALFLFTRLPDVRGAQLHRRAESRHSAQEHAGRPEDRDRRRAEASSPSSKRSARLDRRGRQGRSPTSTARSRSARRTSPIPRRCSSGKAVRIRRRRRRDSELDPAVHRERAGQSGPGVDKGPGRGVEIQLAADPALGAVHVAAVPVPPPLQHLRPHGLRHLFAVVHDDAGDAALVAGSLRAAVLRAAVPHVPAARGLRAGVQRMRLAADLRFIAACSTCTAHARQRQPYGSFAARFMRRARRRDRSARRCSTVLRSIGR